LFFYVKAKKEEEKDKFTMNFRSVGNHQSYDHDIINKFRLPFLIINFWDDSILTVDEASGALRYS
jgi:hypothetical protein